MSRTTIQSLRLLTTLGLLALLAGVLDPAAVIERVRHFDAVWMVGGLALCALQIFASAARWRLTAAALGVPISRRRAVADYYLAGLANQLLPGGILGDAARAARHAQISGQAGPAVRAVVLERASGQLVLLIATTFLLFGTPLGRAVSADLASVLSVAGLAGGLTLALLTWRQPRWLRLLINDARCALFSRRLWVTQLALSLIVCGALCGTFICAGRMLGVEVGSAELLVLAPLVLLAMLIPISVGGWGVRESAAAGLFALAGHAPETGVAVSIAYGILTLVATLPGALVPLISARRLAHPV